MKLGRQPPPEVSLGGPSSVRIGDALRSALQELHHAARPPLDGVTPNPTLPTLMDVDRRFVPVLAHLFTSGDVRRMRPVEIVVYLYLKLSADLRSGECLRSQVEIARATGASVRSVFDALRELEKRQYLKRKGKRFVILERVSLITRDSDQAGFASFPYVPIEHRQMLDALSRAARGGAAVGSSFAVSITETTTRHVEIRFGVTREGPCHDV